VALAAPVGHLTSEGPWQACTTASGWQRYPAPSGWEPLDVRELPLAAYGLRLVDFTQVETRLPMNGDEYLRYMLSEVSIEHAIASGACSRQQARDWCLATLGPVFAGGPLTVVIPGHIATLVRTPGPT
jgi:hypothetical protein